MDLGLRDKIAVVAGASRGLRPSRVPGQRHAGNITGSDFVDAGLITTT
jgi:hypothetical protein